MKKIIIALTIVMAIALGMTACGGSRTITTQAATTKPAVTMTTAVVTSAVAPTTTTQAPTTPATTSTRSTTSTTNPPTTTVVKTSTMAATSSQPANTAPDIAAILGKASTVKSMSYDMVTTSGTVVVNAKVYFKGSRMRMDVSSSGQNVSMYIDTAAKTIYMYDATSKMLMSIPWSDTNESASEKAGDILGYHPTVVGTAIIDGHQCTIVQYTYGETGSTVNAKSWIWNDNGLPIRMEITDKNGTSTIEFKNISLSDIPDSTFVPPAGASTFVIPTGIPTAL